MESTTVGAARAAGPCGRMGAALPAPVPAPEWSGRELIRAIALCALTLERRRPVEPITNRAAVRVDIVYTLIHRLGLFQLLAFFALQPLWDTASAWARWHDLPTFQLDALVAPAWPGVTDTAWFSFAVYLLVFDFLAYLLHRAQHRWAWWWSLHALHHSQRQMTTWSDDRNHLLDDAIQATVTAGVARLIGVGPEQFVGLVAATQLLQSFSHANARVHFGAIGERLLVSPRFHREHHAAQPPVPGDAPTTPPSCNFAVLFPIWDVLLGTARFEARYLPTGIRDQWPQHGGHDYGRGFWSQQLLGLHRLARALKPGRRQVRWERHD